MIIIKYFTEKTLSSSQLRNKTRSDQNQAKASSVHSLKSDHQLETKVSRVRVQEPSSGGGEDEEQKKAAEMGPRPGRSSKTLSASNLQ